MKIGDVVGGNDSALHKECDRGSDSLMDEKLCNDQQRNRNQKSDIGLYVV